MGTDAEDPTDESLMEALQSGEDAALGTLMSRWELPVKAFLARMGVASSAVEDLSQETFVRLYQHRGKYRSGSRFKPWLLTVAGNLARNSHRWAQRHPAESLDALAEERPGGGEWLDTAGVPPDAKADAAQLAELVRASISRLPQTLREPVVLVDLEDLSYVEAAKVLDCSVKSVETRLYRARNALRDALRPHLSEIGVAGE